MLFSSLNTNRLELFDYLKALNKLIEGINNNSNIELSSCYFCINNMYRNSHSYKKLSIRGFINSFSLINAFPIFYWLGLSLLRKNWARIYSPVLIFLFVILMLTLPFINKVPTLDRNELIIVMLIMFCFFSWWAYSLRIDKASKEYFLQ